MGASGAQHRPSLASGSLSEYIRRPCHSQTQSFSRPACQEIKLERSWISRPWLCVEREAPSTLPPVLCGFVFPGPGGGDAFGDTKKGAGRPFLSPGMWETEAHMETAGLTGCQGLPLSSSCHPCSLKPACSALAAHSHSSTCCWCLGAERQVEGRWLWLLFEHLIIPD